MKRIFESEGEENNEGLAPQLKRQRPLLGAMREVMGVQSMQKHLPKLEPFLRRVVQEEVGKALYRFVQSTPRLPVNRIQATASKRYRLHFQNHLPQTLFTGSKIEAEGRAHVEITIIDTESNKKITSGPLSSAKIEILVLDGDFGGDGQEEWSEKEFADSVVREREGKRPLLTGELVITLNSGIGYLVDATFTDNSSWIRSRKFRLGARLQQSRGAETIVHEAISEPFLVKDHRGELYKKHHPPAPEDDVWRLEKIGKDGAFHKRLAEDGINTVQDFLRSLVVDPGRLRSLLGGGMSNKIWEATVEHAKECVLDDKLYSYCSEQGVVLLLNSIFQVVGAMFEDRYLQKDDFSAPQKVIVNKLKQLAYQNLEKLVELNMPVVAPLPRSLTVLDTVSVQGASCSGPQIPHISELHQDEPAIQAGFLHHPTSNELLDCLVLKDYGIKQGSYPGQLSGSLPSSSFNMREFLDTPYGDISTMGLAGPITTVDQLTGYNTEIDNLAVMPPLPNWDHGNGFNESSSAESGPVYMPHTRGVGDPRISSGKWVKLVAALKLMAVSKQLASKKDRTIDASYSTLPLSSSMCGDLHEGWFT